ncbi:MAG TPA: nicotinate phosphoribosyltransferase [Gemmataceae bacterium]|nr:nicotinate phosphoribosyltransferase [Gemmataceae bacterium]
MSPSAFSLGLFTDFYELTMAQAYWQDGHNGPATFSLFFRDLPHDRGYLVFAGLYDVLDYLQELRFTAPDIDYLRSLHRFDVGFLDYLQNLRFTGSVRAMREGTIVFANEPVIEIAAPLIEAQLIETMLVNEVNLQTILATKASRVVYAARGRQVIDFAARRAHGIDAANKFSRASYLAGFDGTSNTLASALYGIPVSGTMAHSLIMSYDSEINSFRVYARSFPDSSTLLVDTYDTLSGTHKSAVVAEELKKHGHRLQAIRLDSGNLLELSRKARAILDGAALKDVKIFASGGLDEFQVHDLVYAGAPIDGFGVGTKVGVSADAPWTDSVYKLVDYDGRTVLKLSNMKETLPGPKQVFRQRNSDGSYAYDIITQANRLVDKAEPLLHEVMANGKRLLPDEPLNVLRPRFAQEFAYLPAGGKALHSPTMYEVRTSVELERLREQVVQETKKREVSR